MTPILCIFGDFYGGNMDDDADCCNPNTLHILNRVGLAGQGYLKKYRAVRSFFAIFGKTLKLDQQN